MRTEPSSSAAGALCSRPLVDAMAAHCSWSSAQSCLMTHVKAPLRGQALPLQALVGFRPQSNSFYNVASMFCVRSDLPEVSAVFKANVQLGHGL